MKVPLFVCYRIDECLNILDPMQVRFLFQQYLVYMLREVLAVRASGPFRDPVADILHDAPAGQVFYNSSV